MVVGCFGRRCRLVRRLTYMASQLKGPMAQGDKFIELDESYLGQFDDIVVIGDIHGCYEEFKELLERVHSETPSRNPDKCLKILVGDLVNKGPRGKDVIRLCRDIYPESILAVRGNHDEIVLRQREHFETSRKPLDEERNRWVERLPARYVSYLRSLPYTITIPALNCIIVHAGLDPSLEEPAKRTPTEFMTTMRNIVVLRNPKTNDPYYKCTKSEKEGAAWALFWPGPQHVYFGHDARRRLQDEHEFATGLDTGCVYGDRLSYVYIKGPRKGELCSVKAKRIYEATSDNGQETTTATAATRNSNAAADGAGGRETTTKQPPPTDKSKSKTTNH